MADNCHLVGRMPHGEVDALINDAAKATCAEDVDALKRRAKWIGEAFVAVVRDFRATVPKRDQKHGEWHGTRRPAADDWLPVASAFEDDDEQLSDLIRGYPHLCWNKALLDWRDDPYDGYDDRPSALLALIAHGKLATVRRMIDSGVDIEVFWGMRCYAGGGMNLALENVEAYLWLNQAILLGSPLETMSAELSSEGYHGEMAQEIKHDPERCRLLASLRCLVELSKTYDNRDHRYSNAGYARRDMPMTVQTCKEEVKDVIFPFVYSLSHLFVYNEVRHHGVPAAALEDPKHIDRLLDGAIATRVTQALHHACCHVCRPLEGVSKRLWDLDGSVIGF